MVLFEVKNDVGCITLDREPALNSLNLEMVDAMLKKLRQWQDSRDVKAVVIRGAGPKAFCAGGDVKTVCIEAAKGNFDYARDFFSTEYDLDYLIHASRKPVVVVGHGLVMGGGIGLLAGAAVRVVTETSSLAMPEISIGLFPDVGGSYFLNRMPGKTGLFLALTAARMNPADALYSGLANVFIPNAEIDRFCAGIAEHAHDLQSYAKEFEQPFSSLLPPGKLAQHSRLIDHTLDDQDPKINFGRLQTLAKHDDPWLAKAAVTFNRGSPTSAFLISEQIKRGAGMDLKDCFGMELKMATQCCKHHDFSEGVRALLIDKDQHPKWNPPTLAQVTPRLIEDHFQ